MNERGYRMVFDGCTGLPSIAYDQLENHKDGTVIYNDHQKLTWQIDIQLKNDTISIISGVQL